MSTLGTKRSHRPQVIGLVRKGPVSDTAWPSVRYEGLFECVDADIRRGLDKSGNERKIIVFELAPVSSVEEHGAGPEEHGNRTLEELRKAAYQAAAKIANHSGPKGTTSRSWYERTEDVRRYVLARASGVCECCGKPAPFKNKAGQLYLEPHHTTRRADSGLDHPAQVAGICPACHRRVHFGIDGVAVNEELKATIHAREQSASAAPLPLAGHKNEGHRAGQPH